jgi:catechol 2,3-dioxygenase-like lactoylglutathione lyase family enzyme
MAQFEFDHAVIVVAELREAVASYSRAGFDVREGGRHQGSPTHNALIPIGDQSYLELLATRSRFLPPRLRRLWETPRWQRLLARRTPVQQRFLELSRGRTGFADFCLWVSDLERTIEEARLRGLGISDPSSMGRRRHDGEPLEWRLAVPAAHWLPFLIEDRTARRLRVPEPRAHSGLRLQRISQIVVPVPDVREVASGYERLLGRAPVPSGASGAIFSIADLQVVLCGSGRDASAQRPWLRLVAAGRPSQSTGRFAADGIHLVSGDDPEARS